MGDVGIAVFDFFQSFCNISHTVHAIGMNHAVHTGGNSGLAILIFLTFLTLPMVVFTFSSAVLQWDLFRLYKER
jgi:hypothetical protein